MNNPFVKILNFYDGILSISDKPIIKYLPPFNMLGRLQYLKKPNLLKF